MRWSEARAAGLKQLIRFKVRPFAMDDSFEPHGEIMTLVREFAAQAAAGRLETLFVIHPGPRSL